jgi:hypothetical protein
MRPLTPKLKREIDADPYFKTCARKGEGYCDGRITIEHAFIYQGRQINELWALVPLCWHHHLGSGLDKKKNQWISLKRATIADLKKYPNYNWLQQIQYLNKQYD